MRFSIILTLILLTVNLTAQESINLDRALEMALENNPNLKIAKFDLEKAQNDVDEAYGYAMPRIDLNSSYTRAIKKQELVFNGDFFPPELLPPDINIDFGTQYMNFFNTFRTSLELNQTLFDYTVLTGIGSSKIYEKASQEMVYSQMSKTIKDTKTAFFASLLQYEAYQLMNKSFENAQKRYNEINILFQEGLVSEFDNIRAEVQVENLKPEVQKAQNNYRNSLNNLKIVLGMDQSSDIKLEGSLNDFMNESTIPDLNAAYGEVTTNNNQLKAIDYQVQVQDAFIEVEKANYFPRLNLFGNVVSTNLSDEWDFQTINQSDVGLRFSMNLFSGFQTDAIVQKELLVNSLKSQTENYVLDMQRAKDQVEASIRNVDQAKRGYEIAQVRYKEGLGSLLEINDSELALRQAEINKIQSIFDYLNALAAFDDLSGKNEN